MKNKEKYVGLKEKKKFYLDEFYKLSKGMLMQLGEMDYPIYDKLIIILQEKIHSKIIGYPITANKTPELITKWYKEKYKLNIKPKEVIIHTGALTAILTILNTFLEDKSLVLIDNPVYVKFKEIIFSSKFKLVENILDEKGNSYIHNFYKLEENLKKADAYILCSPHNPSGTIWGKEELRVISFLCDKHSVLLISDEVHGDLTFKDYKFISMIEMNSNAIVINSNSKSFNLSGLSIAYTICNNLLYNEMIRNEMNNYNLKNENTLNLLALEVVYINGLEWLTNTVNRIQYNYDYLQEALIRLLPKLKIFELQASYFIWIDFSEYFFSERDFESFLIDKCKIIPLFGKNFGEKYQYFIRVNIAVDLIEIKKFIHRISSNIFGMATM